jgi:hypothetical protein
MDKKEELVVVAGDSGCYVGLIVGGASAWDGGVVKLRNARFLRRYYVAGRTGDGSVSDLAARGLCPGSPSISEPTAGITALNGVRRILDVGDDVAASFGVPS